MLVLRLLLFVLYILNINLLCYVCYVRSSAIEHLVVEHVLRNHCLFYLATESIVYIWLYVLTEGILLIVKLLSLVLAQFCCEVKTNTVLVSVMFNQKGVGHVLLLILRRILDLVGPSSGHGSSLGNA